MLGISIFLLYRMDVAWWYYLILALGPDLSMVGYAAGNKVGAFCYNLVHHKGLAIVLLVIGLIYQEDMLICIGLILFGHSSMDRMFGYGLKTNEGFKFTHLGAIGKK